MSTPNPTEDFKSTPPVSSKTFHVAGILATVYGLDELPNDCKSISCLWLLHGRLQRAEVMANVAYTCLHDWHQRVSSDHSKVGFIAVAFDQRNHGTREVYSLANKSWKEGNDNHAQDIVLHGTATDVSLLIDHLGSYIFHGPNTPSIDQHMVLGISLGGHAAWQIFFSEPRVTTAVVIIGCPDYMHLMNDRAQRSKVDLKKDSQNADEFLGSTFFPNALVESMKKNDPRGIVFGTSDIITSPTPDTSPSQAQIRAIFDQRIRNKKILICSGGADRLVPYRSAEQFLNFFKKATAGDGWYKDGNVYVEDNVYEGIGHAYSEEMVKDTTRFLSDILAGGSGAGSLSAKM
ncbi:hypothetical protein BP5796_02455 [Coleophoma crateriformis]|uniref:AB hydrolase-1 domain-containing protein n=1 Tax=Coleophoma crateriformis TaxID=565419 RepID=A0A3D8SYF4_9HELO|nr:hypothetical protein BP5796_02455 [Coleophoma crateriformis]